MIRKKYEHKQHIVKEDVLVEERRFCDLCGKEITEDYWKVETRHSDWGSESIESLEYFDICSVECLGEKFKEYSDESDNGDNTLEFKAEHRNWSDVRGVIENGK